MRNLRRAQRRRRSAELPDLTCDESGPVIASERRELVDALRSHVAELPGDLRQVMLLRLQHGLTAVEVGEVLGLSAGSVRMRWHRGLAALRRLLPASLVALLGAMLPTRGVAAMRATVLGAAAGQAVSWAGGIMAKKLLVACSIVLVAAFGWLAIKSPQDPVAAPLSPSIDAARPVSTSAGAAIVPAATIAVAPAESPAVAAVAADAGLARSKAPEPVAAATTGALDLRVVTYERNEPVAKATALLAPSNGDPTRRRTITTDAVGRAHLGDLPAGDYRLSVHCGPSRTVTIAAGVTTTAEVDVMTGNPARGIVVGPDGRPAIGARIVLRDGSDTFDGGSVDEQGRFQLAAVYPFFLVGARCEGFAPSGLHALSPEREMRIELPSAAAVIAGKVVDTSGRCIAGAHVLASSQQPPEHWQDALGLTVVRGGSVIATSGVDGTFTIEAGAGALLLQVSAAGHAPWERIVEGVVGQQVQTSIVMTRSEPLRGRIVDENGVAVADVSVQLGGENGPLRASGPDGRFEFASVPSGALQLDCRGEHIEPLHAERIGSEAGEWRLVVQRRPQWRLRFVDEAGTALAHWMVRCEALDVAFVPTDGDGRATVRTPVAERGRLELHRKTGSLFADWPADANLDAETTVVVPRAANGAAIVQGVFVEADGTPASELRVALLDRAGTVTAVTSAEDGRFELGASPGDHQLIVQRGDGAPEAPFAVAGLRVGEVRDLGMLRLLARGQVVLRFVLPGGRIPTDVELFFDESVRRGASAPENGGSREPGVASTTRFGDGGVPWFGAEPRSWPVGSHSFRLEASNALSMRGSFVVRAGEVTTFESVLTPAIRQRVRFPVPTPAWGSPTRFDYELLAPNGAVVATGTHGNASGAPFSLELPMCAGRWRVRLTLPDGAAYAGEIVVADEVARVEPFEFEVAPVR